MEAMEADGEKADSVPARAHVGLISGGYSIEVRASCRSSLILLPSFPMAGGEPCHRRDPNATQVESLPHDRPQCTQPAGPSIR